MKRWLKLNRTELDTILTDWATEHDYLDGEVAVELTVADGTVTGVFLSSEDNLEKETK